MTKLPGHRAAAAAAACVLLAAATRLPGLGAGGAGASEVALRLPSAVAGALTAALAALVAGRLAGPRSAAWAGVLVALSPIHTLASRGGGPEAPLVLLLMAALALFFHAERAGGSSLAAPLGAALGLLAASGVAAFAAVALVPLLALLLRPDRHAAVALGTGALVAGGCAVLGLARSPFDFGEIPTWIPQATACGILRCTGASFTRVAGLEYQLAVPHARDVAPLTALLVGLMATGAARLAPRARLVLVGGAVLPFAVGVALSLATGRVLPLQASRLLAALPFVALLLAVGLASLSGWRAWAAGAAVAGTLVGFLLLALTRPDGGGRAIIDRWATPPGPGASSETATSRSRVCCSRLRSRSIAPSTTASSPGRSTWAGDGPTSAPASPRGGPASRTSRR